MESSSRTPGSTNRLTMTSFARCTTTSASVRTSIVSCHGSVIHQTKAFGKLTPPLSDTFDFLFVYCDKVQVQNTGNKQLTNVIALISRENLTASKNYLTFRPMKLQYVPVLQNIDSITSIYVKIASENGIKLEVGKGGATETRISLHACSEKYLT